MSAGPFPTNHSLSNMRIAFQGEIGAFSEEAVMALYDSADLIPRPTFEAVFETVAGGDAERAVIPIENSLFGSVHTNYDLLREHDLSIVGEVQLRIRHNIMACDGASLAGIRKIHSHPQAIGQCLPYLRRNVPGAEIIPAYDTAGAAKMVSTEGRLDEAAIASARAAKEYGLAILAENVESNHQNYTRFLALSAEPGTQDSGLKTANRDWKTSLVYSMKANVPGALFKSLAVFALRELDLFKIESRPLVGSPGSYLFYLDVEGSRADETVQRALEHLTEIASYLKVLGSYPIGDTVD